MKTRIKIEKKEDKQMIGRIGNRRKQTNTKNRNKKNTNTQEDKKQYQEQKEDKEIKK